MSQVLAIVRLKGRFDLPQALALDYSHEDDDALQSSVGMLQNGLSGHYGDYPILLKLPAGRYQLRSLRIAGSNRNTNSTLLTRLDETFDAMSSDIRYIGRLVVSNANQSTVQPFISWQNRYDEDSLLAKSLGRGLQGQEIINASGQFDASSMQTFKEQQITIGKVEPSVLSVLSDKQKPLFRQFLRASHPRAFAIGDFGAAGFASGDDAINLALQRCGRRGNKDSCRVLAIDDAVVLSPSTPES